MNMILQRRIPSPVVLPEGQAVHQLFEAQVEKNPDRVAVQFDSQSLTYSELNRSANRFAAYLVSKKITRGAVVAVCLDRSIELLPILLGIMKAGAVYLPLDPAFPADRLNYMAEDAGAAFLVINSHYQTLLDLNIPQFTVEQDWNLLANYKDANHTRITPSSALAYTIYTSGSTGKPKGVEVSHGNVVNFLNSMAHTPGLTASDQLLAVTTISFDIHVLELFLPLTVGARVFLVEQAMAGNAYRLAEVIDAEPITAMQATPATWRMLISAGWQGKKPFKILIGGEAFPKDLQAPLLQRCTELWNMYGPTETTVWSTCYQIQHADQPIFIGKPIDNTELYIVDEDGRAVTDQAAGELLIGGSGVTRGYHNRPELTREKFIDNPFDSRRAGKLYKTGDLARFAEDGNVELLGRIDNQVKIRGYRIELGEIEATIAEFAGIEQAVVDLVDVKEGERRLVAFCKAQDQQLDTSGLRLHIGSQLPQYMVPQHFTLVDEMPLTPNRKLDRKALVAQFHARSSNRSDTTDLPDSDLERALLLTWRRVLNNGSISVDDSFVEAGGESILAFDLIHEMRRATGIEFPYEKMLENPSVTQLANSVANERLMNPYNIIPLQSAGEKPPLYCLCGVNLYQELANNLGRERAVFGIYSPQEIEFLDRVIQGGEAEVSVEELATLYSHAILQQSPDEPIHILGFSFGGVVAVETARLLQLAGKQVGVVVLVDSLLPTGVLNNPVKRWSGRCRRALDLVGSMAKRALRFHHQRNRARSTDAQSQRVLDQSRIEAARNKLYNAATSTYVASSHRYNGKVILLKARDHAMLNYCDLAQDYGWSSLLCSPPQTYLIPGEHLDLLRGSSGTKTAEIIKDVLTNG